MKKSIILFLVMMALNASSQLKFKLYGDSLKVFSYKGGDEFNATQLDEEMWKNGLEGRRVIMTQDLSFSPNNVILKDGLVRFLAKKEDSTYVMWDWEIDSAFLKRTKRTLVDNKFLTNYSAGSIVSKKKLHYGFYEIRFKVEEGRGIWPAFWFFGGKQNEEIDAFELKGEKNNLMHLDTHCPYGCDKGYKNKLGFKTNWGDWMPSARYLHEGFNFMALEWKKDEVFWYLNGYPVAYFKGDFPNPMNLYLNTSVAKDGDAFDPGPDATTKWPNTYYVDHLRIWEDIKTPKDLKLKVNDDFLNSELFPSDYKNAPTKKRGLLYLKKVLNPMYGTITVNIDSKHRLFVSVLGKCAEQGMKLQIKSKNTDVVMDKFEKETTIPIDPRDKELELQLSYGKKQYIQKISLP